MPLHTVSPAYLANSGSISYVPCKLRVDHAICGISTREGWRESLSMVERNLSYTRRFVHSGERVYLCGDSFDSLFLVNSGIFTIMNLSPDGREQPAGFYFKGDWLGFDGLSEGRYSCSAVAVDSGEVWTVGYEGLQRASAAKPELMRYVLNAMSIQLASSREALLSIATLTADARVADFLLTWAHSLEQRGQRTDHINLNLSRADMGRYLGLTLESVSRALSKLARCGIIEFREKGRRYISIPHLTGLSDFIHDGSDQGKPTHAFSVRSSASGCGRMAQANYA